ncbi:MAG TPA: hypothetical protein VG847_12310 [Chitinophagaceae bacterium]|nr:hypothetical protein [Chitinophagaceae bacterium]
MESYTIVTDIKTFGKIVPGFPTGIGEAFDELVAVTGNRAGERDYYGISEYKNGKMNYYAVAAEKSEGEGQKLGYEILIISKGHYLVSELQDWKKNTHCIKDIFMEMMQDKSVDKEKPAIEWYKNDHEMFCMLSIKK